MKDTALPFVTFGIPTYNQANGYLQETLECALAQTYPNVKIVIATRLHDSHVFRRNRFSSLTE